MKSFKEYLRESKDGIEIEIKDDDKDIDAKYILNILKSKDFEEFSKGEFVSFVADEKDAKTEEEILKDITKLFKL